MPSHERHLEVDNWVLGEEFPEVHALMDTYQPILQSNHRLLLHDMKTVYEIAEFAGERAGWSAYLHILLDLISDKVGKPRSVQVLLEMIFNG